MFNKNKAISNHCIIMMTQTKYIQWNKDSKRVIQKWKTWNSEGQWDKIN